MNLLMIPVALSALGQAFHGAGLLVWSVLFAFRRRFPDVPTESLVRLYRGWGPVSGVALGVWIFASLWRFPLVAHPGDPFPDCYRLWWGTLVDDLTTVRAAVFGAMWVSYTVLEVWTLEPCRLLDKGEIQDRPAYEAAVRRVSRHLVVNAMLFLAVAVMGALGARP